eukprot:2771744-Amphidinium_carterae.1
MCHKTPDCWWQGPTYTIDQYAPVTELPTSGQQYERSTQVTQTLPSSQRANLRSTTRDQPLATQGMTITTRTQMQYDSGQY